LIQHWFTSDCCGCKFEVNQRGEFLESVIHCNLHVMPDGRGHYQAVLAHNRGFNTAPGRTDEQRENDRAVEFRRIKNL